MSSRAAKGRISHAQRYAITATQTDLTWRAYGRSTVAIAGPRTGPRAGFALACSRMTAEHWQLCHGGYQSTSPLSGTRASRRRSGKGC